MSKKFEQLTVDEETTIVLSFETQVGNYDVVYQKWKWGNIDAESIIFLNEDVSELSEEQVKNLVVQETALVKDKTSMTYKKGAKYSFVNFNFHS